MELSIVLSGKTAPAKLVAALESSGFSVESPFDGHGFPADPRTGYVRCHRTRTSALVPVISADSDIDAADLDDAANIAASHKWNLRKHSHRSVPVESDEEAFRRIVREEIAASKGIE